MLAFRAELLFVIASIHYPFLFTACYCAYILSVCWVEFLRVLTEFVVELVVCVFSWM